MRRVVVCLILLGILFPVFAFGEEAHDLSIPDNYYIRQVSGISGPDYVLSFRENGYLRHMLVLGGVDYENDSSFYFRDYFSGEHIFDAFPYRMIPSDYQARNISNMLFLEGTMISHIDFIHFEEYGWFWAFNPDLDEEDLDDLRFFYESVFPAEQRFPRKQAVPRFRTRSPIPNGRDDEPVPEEVLIVEVYLENIPDDGNNDEVKYRRLWLFAEKTDGQIHKGVVRKGDGFALRELFTGTWLSNGDYGSLEFQYLVTHNQDFFDSILPGFRLINEFYAVMYGNPPLTEETMLGAWKDREPYYDEPLYYLAGFINQAETIGDLRRVYESIPKDFWFIPLGEDHLPPEIAKVPESREPGTHYVADAAQLDEALRTAKNGENIVLLGDIPVTDEAFTIKGKKLKISGLPGQKPAIRYDTENEISSQRIFSGRIISLFYLDNANVEFENILFDMSGSADFIMLLGKSEVRLGPGTEITGCHYVIQPAGNSSIIVDGASIHHNRIITRAVGDFESVRFHMISGEIAYNSSPSYLSVINTGTAHITYKKQDSSFVMDGGAIHHNSSLSGEVIKLMGLKKAEINGGEIYRNTASGAPITVYNTRLTINGGELYNNAGDRAGCVAVGGLVPDSYVQSINASLVMNGGAIHDNFSYDSKDDYDFYGGFATDILVFDYFEMKGGEIRKTPGRPGVPSILVIDKRATCTISGGAIDLDTIETQEGGKLVNKLKK